MPTDLSSILKIEVPVIVLIAEHRLKVSEVRALSPGAIIELPKSTEDDLEILITNQAIGAGRAVKVGENFGVKVTYVGDLQHRIKALGPLGGTADPDLQPDQEAEGAHSPSEAERVAAGP